VWDPSITYTTGALVTLNNQIFLALAGSTNVTPATSAAIGIWGGVVVGTGDSPGGIPYVITAHNLSAFSTAFFNPAGNSNNTGIISGTSSTLAPVACTPSMTIYSFLPDGGTFTLYSATTTSTTNSFSQGSAIMSCAVSGSSGSAQTCTTTNAGQVSAGTVMTLNAPLQTSNSSIFYAAFSCY
jgi:hypothetical protein